MAELSIIVPTYNEENYLGILLESLKRQEYKNYEIIVADNNSQDKTVLVAKKFKCKVVNGGLPGVGRNNGAKVAKGRLLLFMDADVVLPDNTLDKLITEFKKRRLDVASLYIEPLEKNFLYRFYHWIWNLVAFITQYFDPQVSGAFLLCKKSVFKLVGGFDETITFAEDMAYGRKAKELKHKVRILKSARVKVSTRRFKVEGKYRLGFKYMLCFVHRMSLGEIKSHIFHYTWEYRRRKSVKT